MILALLIVGVAAQQARFTYERPITTNGAGPHRLEVDAALMSGAQPVFVATRGTRAIAEGGLGDLRLFDAAGGVVPYLLIPPAPSQPTWLPATTLPLPVTKTSSGFEADLGAVRDVDALRVDGIRAPFLKRLTLEGSGDRERWTVLVSEGTLFDLPNERLQQTSVRFTRGRFRYLRVTWNDANSGRVGMPRAVLARPAAVAGTQTGPASPVEFERRASEPGRSRYVVKLPAARLPVVALDLSIAGGHVFRPAVVLESRLSGAEAVPFELGRATLTRVVREGASAESLRVPITAPTGAELDLVIEDGGNAPLELTGIAAVFAELPQIYFEAPANGTVIARYGDRSLSTPSYDLEAVRRTIDLASVPLATWGTPAPLAAGPATGTSPSAFSAAGAELDPELFSFARPVTGPAGLAAVTLDAAALAHSRGPSTRFADVRLMDDANRQIPYLVERRDEPLSVDVPLQPRDGAAFPEFQAATGRRSLYAVNLPFAGLPQPQVVLNTSERVFQRQVRIGAEREPDRRHRDKWFEELGSANWRHADRQTAASALSIPIRHTDVTTLLIAVDEGDNAALPLTQVRLLLPTYRLRFYQPAGAVRLMYGRRDLEAPKYDLALLAPQVMGSVAAVATAGPESADAAATATGRSSVISPLTFWILLGGAVLVLVSLIVRLVKTTDRT